MKWKRSSLMAVVTTTLLATAVTSVSTVFAQEEAPSHDNTTPAAPTSENVSRLYFEAISHDLEQMQELFKFDKVPAGGDLYTQQDNNRESNVQTTPASLSFDSQVARSKGFLKDRIKLAEEMAAFNNELLQAATRGVDDSGDPINVMQLPLNKEKYPNLATYLYLANNYAKDAQPSAETRAALPCLRGLIICTCGDIGLPRPTRAAPWKTYRGYTEDLLRRWGFHKTASKYGGGWTRDQTYKSLLCRSRTYRDHALVIDQPSYPIIRVQDYNGFAPRGEPNPESVGRWWTWPHPNWGAYVWWWHRNF